MGWDESSDKCSLDKEDVVGVEFKDFRVVCVVFMDLDDGEERENVELGSDDGDDDEDVFQFFDVEFVLILLLQFLYGGMFSKSCFKKVGNKLWKMWVKGKGMIEGQINFFLNQRVMVKDIWDMFKFLEKQKKFGVDILG